MCVHTYIHLSYKPHIAMYIYVRIYIIICIGIPVPIVTISAGIAHDHYGHDEL